MSQTYTWDFRKPSREVRKNDHATISPSQFISFVEDRVLPVLRVIVAERLPNSNLRAIFSWSHFESAQLAPETPLVHHPFDASGTDILRIFFVREENPTLRGSQLIFQLTAAGKLVISSSRKQQGKLATLLTLDNTEYLEPSHIHGLLDNHFNNMLATL